MSGPSTRSGSNVSEATTYPSRNMRRPMRVCNVPDCPTISESTRCAAHRAEAERARGSRQQRGYDADHDRARASWLPRVATGTVRCRRCRELIAPDAPWDLGHPDAECPAPRAPECQRCNRAAGGRSAHL